MRIMLAAVAAALLLTSPAAAQDLFRMDVPLLGLTNTNNDVVDLITGMLDQSGPFMGLQGEPGYVSGLGYLGVESALVFEIGDSGNSLDLVIPSIGKTISFSAGSPSELGNEVESWLKDDGIGTWASFLQAMNGKAPLALLSGNPRATTALMANSAYRHFGMRDEKSRLGYREQEVTRFSSFGMNLEISGGTVSTDRFSGDLKTIDGRIDFAGEIGKTVGLSFAIIGQYRDYQGAQLFDVGAEIAIPIRILRPTAGNDLYWAVTPMIQVAGGASKALAAGGLFVGGGLVNALALQRGMWEFGMANELAYYNGIPIDDIGGYDFDTDLNQLVMKNGLKVGIRPINLVYAEVGLTFTNFFLDEAAVSFFTTPFVSIGMRLSRYFELRATYDADIAKDDYRTHRGRLELGLRF